MNYFLGFLMFLLEINYINSLNESTCIPEICQNGGHFLKDKCQCECYPNYAGDLCQIILCNIDQPLLCSDLALKDCSITTLYDYCPILCQKCPQVTTTPITMQVNPPCMYGQIFDTNTAKCSCLPGFSGDKCQYFDCDSKIQDAEECVLLDCSIPIEVGSCPRQCSATCLNTQPTTTTAMTTNSEGTILDRKMLRQLFGDDNFLINLTTIDLSNRNIVSIQPATFNGLENLEYLYLNGNKLTVLAASVFWTLKNLRVLELWNNKLNYLPPNLFRDLNKLQNLYLDVNQLNELNANLFKSGLDQLRILDLSSNKIKKLNETLFGKLQNLTFLGLSFNELNELNEFIFRNLTKLQSLNLSVNKLAKLPRGVFDYLFQLKDLRLENNNLISLNESIFSLVNNVNNLNVYLSGNPIVLNQTEYVKGLCRNNTKCTIFLN